MYETYSVPTVIVTNVLFPVVGAVNNTNCTINTPFVNIEKVYYFDIDDNRLLAAGEKFTAGHTCEVNIFVTPTSGNNFYEPSNMTTTVNGKSAKILNIYGEPSWRCGATRATTVSCIDNPSLYSGADTDTLTVNVTNICYTEGFGFYCYVYNDYGYTQTNSVKVLKKTDELSTLTGIEVLGLPTKTIYNK